MTLILVASGPIHGKSSPQDENADDQCECAASAGNQQESGDLDVNVGTGKDDEKRPEHLADTHREQVVAQNAVAMEFRGRMGNNVLKCRHAYRLADAEHHGAYEQHNWPAGCQQQDKSRGPQKHRPGQRTVAGASSIDITPYRHGQTNGKQCESRRQQADLDGGHVRTKRAISNGDTHRNDDCLKQQPAQEQRDKKRCEQLFASHLTI